MLLSAALLELLSTLFLLPFAFASHSSESLINNNATLSRDVSRLEKIQSRASLTRRLLPPGQKPMMGWSPYTAYGCGLQQSYAEENLDWMDKDQHIFKGYNHFILDCGWEGYDRNPDQSLRPDRFFWPDIPGFANKAHAKAVRLGIMTSIGDFSCDTSPDNKRQPGSASHENQDAQLFANWKVDFVKLASCYLDGNNWVSKDARSDFPSRFNAMSKALQTRGIHEIIIDQWGVPFRTSNGDLQGPAEWSRPYGTQYRMADDIGSGGGLDDRGGIKRGETSWNEIVRVMNLAIHIAERELSGPGHFADLDLLQIGGKSGLTYDEQCTHFAFWALFKSPLIMSLELKFLDSKYKWTLHNEQLIAANQDDLGKPIKLFQRITDDIDVFTGPVSGGAMVVLVVENRNRKTLVTINFDQWGIDRADVINMWTNERINNLPLWRDDIQAHGSIAIKLVNIKRRPLIEPTYLYHQAELADLSGGATVISCSGCSGGRKVGGLDGSAKITFHGIRAINDAVFVTFDYINAEIQYRGAGTPNMRGAYIKVNDRAPVLVKFPVSGYSWESPMKSFKVLLWGFKVNFDNVIEISVAPEVSGWAPDFDRIGVVP